MNKLGHIFLFDGLAHPYFLALSLPILLVLLLELLGRPPGAVTLSTENVLAGLRDRRIDWKRRLPAVLRALGLLLLCVALAGPLRGFHVRKDRAGVIDIMLCLDVSGSMQQPDFTINGHPHDRLYVAREAARNFVNSRRETREGRYGLDRIGLILFSGLAWTQCPLTLDYDILEREIDGASIAPERKQGTAIGSTLGLAVRRLKTSEAKSKVVILLTDGVNNRGELDPVTAARLAKEYGIRVYTIGAGSTEEVVIQQGLFPVRTEAIDEKVLRQMADTTGGRYYLATDTESLMKAYDEISALETTEIDIGDYYEANEAFMSYLVLGALLVLASVFSRRLWFEVLP
ncbi:MAG: von Willebrand factor type A domain protein [Candidatus Hydrogenedentes bacterium ADurb.Bin101]|nr:MAG: von Willebrand factor type A domain protein [Candidatus Hydrogenedentes bacterium ADurb.Bin101]